MKNWLLLSTFVLGIFVVMIPEGVNAAERYMPYRNDNKPVSRFYDPAPALTGEYYDRTSDGRPQVTTKRGGSNERVQTGGQMQRNMPQRNVR